MDSNQPKNIWTVLSMVNVALTEICGQPLCNRSVNV